MFKGNLHEFEGKMLSIKVIAGKVELAPSTLYKYLNKGFTLYDAIEEGKKQSNKSFKSRTKTNNSRSKLFEWNNQMMSIPEIAEFEGISKEPIYRRLKKGMKLSDAINEIKNNIAPKYPFWGLELTKYQISKLTGITKNYLDKNLLDDIQYTEEEVMTILDSYKKQEILMYGNETLLSYCRKNDYNYSILYYLIKEKGYTVEEAVSLYTNPNYEIKENNNPLMYGEETLRAYCIKMRYNYNSIYYSISVLGYTIEEAINRYLTLGQNSTPNYKYKVGDVLFFHFLIKMRLDDRYIFHKMQQGKSKEEAIVDAIFLCKEEYKTRTIRNKLRAIYSEIKNIDELDDIRLKYTLTTEDVNFIIEKTDKVKNILTQLKIYESIIELRETINMVQFAKMFVKLGFSLEELLSVVENLYTGFEEQDEYKGATIKYIWNKGM